jgi:hypothetical protein
MTWEEIVNQMRTHHRVDREEGEWCGVSEPVELSDGTRADAKVRVELVTAFGEPWLLLAALIGPETHIAAREALLLSFNMALAAIGIDGDKMYVRSTQCLASLDAGTLERAFDFVVKEAVRLGKRRAPLDPPVDHFAE